VNSSRLIRTRMIPGSPRNTKVVVNQPLSPNPSPSRGEGSFMSRCATFTVAVLAAATLGACVTVDPPRPVRMESYGGGPYFVDDGMDMGTPVYFADYPGSAFYHRYDPYCDCIRLVRLMNSGGAVFWLDQSGRRVHEGHWEPARPSDNALREYRRWSQQHRGEFHRSPPPPPGRVLAPPQAAPQDRMQHDHAPKAGMPPQQPPAPSNAVIQRHRPSPTQPTPPAPPTKPGPAVNPPEAGQAAQRDAKSRQERHPPNRPVQKQARPPQAAPQAAPQTAPQTDKAGPRPPKAGGDSKPPRDEPHKKCPDGQKDC
jgi:hypothetical protein